MSIWSGVKKIIGGGAPLIGALLGGPAGGLVGGLLSSALGEDVDVNDPRAVEAALHRDPAALSRLREIEITHKVDLEKALIQAETAQLAEINKTMRGEIASNDAYVRRWRPTLGYAVSLTWAVMMICTSAGVLVPVILYPDKAPVIINAIGTTLSMTMGLWGIALSILGVSVVQRSRDKAVSAGQRPATLLEGLGQIIRGPRGDK
tara:strand:- start:9269 stop:9883 length:615 start_codon:yes stop_codon:yes gene_type:complete